MFRHDEVGLMLHCWNSLKASVVATQLLGVARLMLFTHFAAGILTLPGIKAELDIYFLRNRVYMFCLLGVSTVATFCMLNKATVATFNLSSFVLYHASW